MIPSYYNLELSHFECLDSCRCHVSSHTPQTCIIVYVYITARNYLLFNSGKLSTSDS